MAAIHRIPKFGEWDVNDPSSAEGFTVIFNKARNEKKTGGKIDSPPKGGSAYKNKATLGKPQSVSCAHTMAVISVACVVLCGLLFLPQV